MKKLALLLACIMVFASLAVLSVSASEATYTAVYVENAPVIDGVRDAAWDAAITLEAAVAEEYNTGLAIPPTFSIMHDDTYIYTLMVYEDLNGTIAQPATYDGVEHEIGGESSMFAFIDDMGNQQEFMFTGPAIADGSYSTGVYINVLTKWVKNLTSVKEGEEGCQSRATRSNDVIVWETRLPKEVIGEFDEDLRLEVFIYDAGAPNIWGLEEFAWAANEGVSIHDYKHILDQENFGTLILAAAGETVEQPVETEPVETEPTETEPEETEPVETEPVETEPVETEPEETKPEAVEPNETEKEDEPAVTTDATEEPADSAFPVVPVIIAAVAVLAIVVVVIVLAKKKKAK